MIHHRALLPVIALAAVAAVHVYGGQQTKPAAAPRRGGAWISAVGNLAPGNWGPYGITYVTAAPGSDVTIASVSSRGYFKSSNGGLTWTQLGEPGQISYRARQIAFDPNNPNTFWTTGIYGLGIFKTTNGGQTFELLANRQGENISVDFSDPDRRTLLTADHERNNTLTVSVSSGRSWHPLADSFPPGVSFLPSACIAYDGSIIAASVSKTRPGIFRSADVGRTWTKVAPYTPSDELPTFGKNGTIYWAGGGVLRSTDNGKTWDKLPAPIHGSPVEAPGGMLVGIGSKQLYASRDNGATWGPYGPPFPAEMMHKLTYNEVRREYYVFHRTNAGSQMKLNTDPTAIMRWSP